MIVKQTLQHFSVAAAVGLVGARHQQGKVLLLGVIPREVRMNALGNLAEQRLEAGRRVKLFGFARRAERADLGLLRALASLRSPAPCRVGVVEVDLPLRDARLQVVELGIQNADLAQVTPFGISLQLARAPACLVQLRAPTACCGPWQAAHAH